MANLKSQIKRNRQNEKRRLRNRLHRGAARVAIKNANAAIESKNLEEARAATLIAVSKLDKAAQKGIFHKSNASRRKGRLMKRLAKREKEA
ncbi:MAG: 30S ribosomal protein S20 [Anaerolineales bacterium]|nr:30S ribosomal protein S20 [Anaerolineales bacterium]